MKQDILNVTQRQARDLTVVIIGSGISGLCMGVKLLEAGFENFTLFEKAESVGGTWRENTYPGIACDIPSQLYSYTFLRNPRWSQMFAPGQEIRSYLERVARKFDLLPRIRFNKEVVSCEFTGGKWHLQTQDGERVTADVVVTAAGFLHIPKYPDIAGRDTFQGRIFHSARWDHSIDLRGKRVANIGTGSSSCQIVPEIVHKVDRVSVFQRTPQWIFPMPNEYYSLWRRLIWTLFPSVTMKMYRAMLDQFNSTFGVAVVGDKEQMKTFRDACEQNLASIQDPELRRKLTPNYEVACKRLVFSTKFYAAIQEPNCELVTDAIKQIEPTGIRTADGMLREFDVIILSTGFKTHEYFRSIRLTGEGGLTLEQAWSDGAKSFETVALAGFPNLFMVGGPYSTVGNLSFVTCAEMQADYIIDLLRQMLNQGATAIVPSPEAQNRFVDDMMQSGRNTVWRSGCNSWYLDEHGNVSIWTKTPSDFVDMMNRGPNFRDFRLIA